MKAKTLLFVIAIFSTINTFAYDFLANGIYYNFLGGDSVEIIDGDKFGSYYNYQCYTEDTIRIPQNVTYQNVNYRVVTIGLNAFRGSTTKRVVIPSSIREIKSYAFHSSCIQDIVIPNSVRILGNEAFAACIYLSSAVLSDYLRGLPDGLFNGCTSLTSVTIGSCCVHMDFAGLVFSDCQSIADIYLLTDEPPHSSQCTKNSPLYPYVFYNVPSSATIHVPSGSIPSYQVDCQWSYFSNFVENTISPIHVEGVSLEKKLYTFPAYTTTSITPFYNIFPDNASNKSVTYTSSNMYVAPCGEDGIVAVSGLQGSAIITCKTKDGGYTDQFAIVCGDRVMPTGVVLDTSILSMCVNDTFAMSATILPSSATVKLVNWKSSNPNVATINNKGQIIAKSTGTTVIQCTTVDGGFVAVCALSVVNNIPVSGITLDYSNLSLVVGDQTTLTPTISPLFASNKSVSWKSSNNTIASVSQTGEITALSAGTTSITCKTIDGGFVATCVVDISAAPIHVTGIQLDRQSLTLGVGDTYTLKETISPSDATNKIVYWSSSNPNVVTVGSGYVRAHSVGTATITCWTYDGGYEAKCSVIVIASSQTVNVTGVTLNKTTLQLDEGGSETLLATIYPSNATNKDLIWTSSNTSVANISNGVVTAISAGVSTIECKTADGSYSSKCYIVVSSAYNETDYSYEPISPSVINLEATELEISSYSDGGYNYASIILSNDDYLLLLFYWGQPNNNHLQQGTYYVTSTGEDGTILYSVGGDSSTDYGSFMATGFTPEGNYSEAYYIIGGSITIGKNESYTGTLYTANGSIINVKYNVGTQYTISTSAINGVVTGGGTYDENAQVTLTAIANEGYQFKEWSDGCTTNPYIITASKDITIEAIFEKISDSLEDLYESSNSPTSKFIIDGQLLILRDGKMYNAQGGEL